MKRVLDVLLRAGLLLSLVGALGQLVIMVLDVFFMPGLRWHWGGSLAYFAAPVAFALTLRLLDERPTRVSDNA